MKVDPEIDIETDREVYEPSDDTYLLLELIDIERDDKVLEIGCGSGVIALHCAKRGGEVTAVDISKEAVETTKENAARNDLSITVKRSDLFSNIERDEWDVIIFNPPYLPRREYMQEDRRWDGGEKGDEVILDFLFKAKDYLKNDGVVYTCYSDKVDLEDIEGMISKHYETTDRASKTFRFEELTAVELKNKYK